MLWLAFWTAVAIAGVFGIVVGANNIRFARQVGAEARALWRVKGDSRPIAVPDLAGLPQPVRRYLTLALEHRRAPIARARVTHGGTFRPGVAQPWLPIRGTQYFAADPPGFVWWGRVRVAPGVWIDARDEAIGGAGGMLVKAESSWTIADVHGPEVDQGALIRLLGEMVWFPTALADERYVSWQGIDDASAEATLRVAGRAVHAVFHFGADSLPERFTAERYRDEGNGRSELTPFTGHLRDYRLHDGVIVPFEIEAAWQLHGQTFSYARFTVEQVTFEPELP